MSLPAPLRQLLILLALLALVLANGWFLRRRLVRDASPSPAAPPAQLRTMDLPVAPP